MTKTETIRAPRDEALDWHWADLRREPEVDPPGLSDDHGWVAWTAEDMPWALVVYRAEYGLRTLVECGSMSVHNDADSWADGKHTCEVALRHARALNAELSRA